MYVANIFSPQPIKTIEIINVVSDISKINLTIPTLIVGWGVVKKMYGENVNILSNKINDNIYWIFSKREDNDAYINGLYDFERNVVKSLYNINKYTFINILKTKFSVIKKLINFIKNAEFKTIYIENGYIYINSNQHTIGLSMIDMNFIGLDDDKIANMLKSKHNKIIDNSNFITHKLYKHIDNVYIIPFLYKIKYDYATL